MKTTKKDFEQFKTECLRFAKEWGLGDYEYSFFHTRLQDGRAAETKRDLEGSSISIWLTTNSGGNERFDILETAKHEMLHVVLTEMAERAQYRYVSYSELEAAEHKTVNRLMKLL